MHNYYVNMGRWGLRAKHRTFCRTGLMQKVVAPAAGNGTTVRAESIGLETQPAFTALMWLLLFFCVAFAGRCGPALHHPLPPHRLHQRLQEAVGGGGRSETSPRFLHTRLGSSPLAVGCFHVPHHGGLLAHRRRMWFGILLGLSVDWCGLGGGGGSRDGWLVGCWGRECLLCVCGWGGGGDWRGGWAREREGWLVGCWGRECCVCVCEEGGGGCLEGGGGGAGDRGEWLVGCWGRRWCVCVCENGGMDVGAESVCVVEGWAGCVFAGRGWVGRVCRERGGWLAGCWDGGVGGG